MTGRVLSVVFVNRVCALVRGHGSRALITELRGHPPVWATLSRAWVVLPKTARDLIAVAESRGYGIEVTEDEAQLDHVPDSPDAPEPPPRKDTLW